MMKYITVTFSRTLPFVFFEDDQGYDIDFEHSRQTFLKHILSRVLYGAFIENKATYAEAFRAIRQIMPRYERGTFLLGMQNCIHIAMNDDLDLKLVPFTRNKDKVYDSELGYYRILNTVAVVDKMSFDGIDNNRNLLR